jgi:hypothetical protein
MTLATIALAAALAGPAQGPVPAGETAVAQLDQATLKDKLGRWLDRYQVEALLKRRDKILALAKKLVAEKGEAAVFYP